MDEPARSMVGISWKGEIGPSFLVIIGQTVAAVVAITMIYASLSNAVENTRQTATDLKTIVGTVQQRNSTMGDRLTKVETTLDDVKIGVGKLSDKVDKVLERQNKPL